MTNKHKVTYKVYDICNILKASETLLNALEQLMFKYKLPEVEVTIKCKRKKNLHA